MELTHKSGAICIGGSEWYGVSEAVFFVANLLGHFSRNKHWYITELVLTHYHHNSHWPGNSLLSEDLCFYSKHQSGQTITQTKH